MNREDVSSNAFEQSIQSSSTAVRRKAFEQFMALEPDEQPKIALLLLESQYRDLGEAVLDYCSEDVVSSEIWTKALIQAVLSDRIIQKTQLCQGLLVIIQRLPVLKEELVTFYRSCLEHAEPDIRYQAYCIAELQEETSSEYLNFVKCSIQSPDEDMRILSVQALARLKPDWAMDELNRCAENAVGVEAFHILLSQIHICSEEQKPEFARKIAVYVGDERFAFAAVQALYAFGDASVIPVLIQYARSFLSEPTTRIAAAAAAAKLGSPEAIKILQKFASSRHGNPNYAKEQLEKLGL